MRRSLSARRHPEGRSLSRGTGSTKYTSCPSCLNPSRYWRTAHAAPPYPGIGRNHSGADECQRGFGSWRRPLRAAAEVEVIDVDLVTGRAAHQVFEKPGGPRVVALSQEQRPVPLRVLLQQQRVLFEEPDALGKRLALDAARRAADGRRARRAERDRRRARARASPGRCPRGTARRTARRSRRWRMKVSRRSNRFAVMKPMPSKPTLVTAR